MRENKTLHYYMKWALMLTFMWVCQFANAQDFVKGKVIDQAGEPVTGAYVRWKDTKIGASTDVDGNFSIPAHQGKLVGCPVRCSEKQMLKSPIKLLI